MIKELFVPMVTKKSGISAVWMITVLILFTACSNDDREQLSTDSAVCGPVDSFVEDGIFSLQSADEGDSRRVASIDREELEMCEQIVIQLGGSEGRPASYAGGVQAELLRDLGVVRLTFPEVERADPDATEAYFNGRFVRAAYAFRFEYGSGLHVDLHLEKEAEMHAEVLENPARVVITLRPGGSPLQSPPVTADRVVVLEPRPGESDYPLKVSGYSRTFEANVVLKLEQHGDEVYETFTTAAGWLDAWGYYSFTLAEGPSGPVNLHIGEHSAKDGTWQGVTVELEMNSSGPGE